MSYAFQDRENLYLIMDLLVGGDLRYHMGCRRRFKETEAKFFIACILIALEFLHLNNIIHRYALLTDRTIWAGEKDEHFVVKIPLLNN